MANYRRVIGLVILLVLVSVQVIGRAADRKFSLTAGYRADDLKWNIGSDFAGSTPNILSELTWDDISSLEFAATSEAYRPIKDSVELALLGRVAYASILSGDNRDSDYDGDNRTLEWSRSVNDAGDGSLIDLEGGGGFRFVLDQTWSVTPLVGFYFYEQNLVIQNGYQVIADHPARTPPVGPLLGLDSRYEASWYGPWLGLQVDKRLQHHMNCRLSARWYSVNYRGEANWNLRTDLQHPVSFEHEADGDGIALELGVDWRANNRWLLAAGLNWRDFKAENGTHLVYFSNGTVGGSRLNEVDWEALSLSISLQYPF